MLRGEVTESGWIFVGRKERKKCETELIQQSGSDVVI